MVERGVEAARARGSIPWVDTSTEDPLQHTPRTGLQAQGEHMTKRDEADAAAKADIESAIAEAVKAAPLGADPADAASAVTVEDVTVEKPEAPAPGEDEPSTGESADADEGAETDLSEQRTEYERLTGVSLEGIPDDLAKPILDQFGQQEGYIHKLQERLSAEPEKPAAPVVEEAPVEVSDEDLLRAAGYDPEDIEVEQMARFILPSLRRELALEDKVAALSQRDEVRETETRWNGALDDLEAQYGKLPFERVQALRYAIEEQIADPEVLYFRLTAPVKKEAETTVRAARLAAAKRVESGGVKPRNVEAGASPVTEEMTLHEAVAAAAKSAEKSTGKSWKDIFAGRDR